MKLNINVHQKYGEHDENKVAQGWEMKELEIHNEQEAREIFTRYHYSPNQWLGGHKTRANFIRYHFICGDVDEGLTIEAIRQRFSDFQYILITSRNHRKPKKI